MSDLTNVRVDQVGSLLRPAALKEAFRRHAKALLSQDELRRAQDDAIRQAISEQEAHALPIITDGEFRRIHFMESFGEVGGMERWESRLAQTIERLDDAEVTNPGESRRGTDPTLRTRHPVTAKLRLVRSRPLQEFEFAQSVSNRPVKVTLLETDRILQGFDPAGSEPWYSSTEEFLADVIKIEREIVQGLAKAGCRYIQLDGPSYTRYVDAASLEVMRSLGEDPACGLERAIQ